MGFTAAIADMIGLGKALGIAPEEAVSLFDHFNPGSTIAARAKRLSSGEYGNASWELAMARKDARLVETEVESAVSLLLVPAIAAKMDAMIARGHGSDDWTVIAKDFVRG
jgi:3-hydroxyisobutyrate dehydrogenase